MQVTRTRRSPMAIAQLWAPPLALMAIIFALSAQPNLSTDLGVFDYLLRKLAHMTEYGLLLFLLWRPLRELGSDRAALVAAFTIGVLYAATDEWHQSFVEGRHGTPLDVAIDAVGMAVATLLILRKRAA
jgi:VanZ family protein